MARILSEGGVTTVLVSELKEAKWLFKRDLITAEEFVLVRSGEILTISTYRAANMLVRLLDMGTSL